MEAIHSIQTVTGPVLSIPMPPAFQGKQVAIVVTALESEKQNTESDFEAKLAALTLKKPELPEEMKRRVAENPNLMTGSVLRYDDPFGPACPPQDWEAIGDSP